MKQNDSGGLDGVSKLTRYEFFRKHFVLAIVIVIFSLACMLELKNLGKTDSEALIIGYISVMGWTLLMAGLGFFD